MTSFEIFSWTAKSIRDHPSITIWNLHLAHVIIPNDVNRKVLIARSDIFIKSIDSSLSLGARNAWDLFRFRVYVRIFLCPSLWNSLRPFFYVRPKSCDLIQFSHPFSNRKLLAKYCFYFSKLILPISWVSNISRIQ